MTGSKHSMTLQLKVKYTHQVAVTFNTLLGENGNLRMKNAEN
ncbi:hypothetical protein [Lactobacillus helveticus]|nr:hypothetical protein [Lactobacillus helveticus]CDI63616.1 Protein of unknown function [Lactobacillus helveticus CIRM-BIA 103]